MHKQLFASLILTVILVASLFMVPATISAQEGTGSFNQTPATDNTTGQAQNQNDNDGFNWMWLLPLLALPLLFFLSRNREGDNRSNYRDEGISGTKGGRSRGNREDDIL